jgi:hypothetical protein
MPGIPGTVPANGGAEQSDGKCHRKHTARAGNRAGKGEKVR